MLLQSLKTNTLCHEPSNNNSLSFIAQREVLEYTQEKTKTKLAILVRTLP